MTSQAHSPRGALAPVASSMPDSCVTLGLTHVAEAGSAALQVPLAEGDGDLP
jgi:hypothetical protein